VSKIYISHKATVDEDRRMAKALAAELEAMGHRAIYNAAELHPGRIGATLVFSSWLIQTRSSRSSPRTSRTP
jgi:hypothetical protein